MDVAGQLCHVGIVFHQDALESPLKQMTDPEMSVIEPSGVRNSEPLHGPGQIGTPGLEQNMVVVGHKNKCVYLHIEPFTGLPQGFKKHLSVRMVIEDIPPLVPSRKDVVICTVVLDSPGPRHLYFCSLSSLM